MILIDKEQLIQDLYSENLDKDEFNKLLQIIDVEKSHQLEMKDVDNIVQILDEFLEGIVNVIDTAETIKLINCLDQND